MIVNRPTLHDILITDSAYELTTRDRVGVDDYEWFRAAMALMRVREKEFAANTDPKVCICQWSHYSTHTSLVKGVRG